jgi:hypothetical protein
MMIAEALTFQRLFCGCPFVQESGGEMMTAEALRIPVFSCPATFSVVREPPS